MTHNVLWRRGVIGLLLVSVVLLTFNLYLLLRFDKHLTGSDGHRTPTNEICADPSAQQQIYVPAYSHIYQDGLPVLMEIALSLRNTDPVADLTISSIDYYDDNGGLLRRYLKQPLLLSPLNSAEYMVERADYAGGMGANFLITWTADQTASPPLAEALMTASENGESVSLASRGVTVQSTRSDASCERRKAGR